MKTYFTAIRAKSTSRYLLWAGAVFFAGLLAFYWDHQQKPASDNPHAPEPEESAATFIPAGFVLVPIEVANYESLDSILGKHGVVDLYIPSNEPKRRPQKVAERVKILRAPLNPSHFAVLAPESESTKLVSYPGPFTVAVQNPKSSGTRFVNDPNEEENSRAGLRSAKHQSPRITVEVSDAN